MNSENFRELGKHELESFVSKRISVKDIKEEESVEIE